MRTGRTVPYSSPFVDIGENSRSLLSTWKLLVMNGKNLNTDATKLLETALSLGDPNSEVALGCRVKEALSNFYETTFCG